jgi:hypothetical protein
MGWTFNPQSGSGLGPVNESSSNEEWGGPVAIGGSVTVTAMDGSDTTYASTSISVSPQSLEVDSVSMKQQLPPAVRS